MAGPGGWYDANTPIRSIQKGFLLAAERDLYQACSVSIDGAELSVPFQPYGITCVLVLAESHLIVSTWPEHKLAHIDLFTCRADTDPEHALEPIVDTLGSANVHNQCVKRVTPFSLPVKAVPR